MILPAIIIYSLIMFAFGYVCHSAYGRGATGRALYLASLFDEMDNRYTALKHRCKLQEGTINEQARRLSKFTGPRDNLGRWMPRKTA